MQNDVEADFWKEILVTMQQKNMNRQDGKQLYFDDAPKAFDDFSKKYPGVKSNFEMAASYATCEMEISPTIKLRLFIQSQIKGTLLQQSGNDFVKIADAKFPNNPFPEIECFFEHKSDYLSELSKLTKNSIRENKKMQLAQEFLKVHIAKKYPDSIWSLEPAADGFVFSIDSGNEKHQSHIPLNLVAQGMDLVDF